MERDYSPILRPQVIRSGDFQSSKLAGRLPVTHQDQFNFGGDNNAPYYEPEVVLRRAAPRPPVTLDYHDTANSSKIQHPTYHYVPYDTPTPLETGKRKGKNSKERAHKSEREESHERLYDPRTAPQWIVTEKHKGKKEATWSDKPKQAPSKGYVDQRHPKHLHKKIKRCNQWRKDMLRQVKDDLIIEDIEGHKMAYSITKGRKWSKSHPTIVILHDALGGVAQCNAIAEVMRLDSESCRFISIARPAYIGTDIELGCLSAIQAVSIVHLLNRLQTENIVLVAFGAGVIISLYICLLIPKRVQRQVLISVGMNSDDDSYLQTDYLTSDEYFTEKTSTRKTIPGGGPIQMFLFPELKGVSGDVKRRAKNDKSKDFGPTDDSGDEDDYYAIISDDDVTNQGTPSINLDYVLGQVQQAVRHVCEIMHADSYHDKERYIREKVSSIMDESMRMPVIKNLTDLLSMKNYHYVRETAERMLQEVFTADSSVDATSRANRIKSVSKRKRRMKFLQAYVDSCLPIRDLFTGYCVDLINMHYFWKHCFSRRDTLVPNQFTEEQQLVPWDRIDTPTLVVQSETDTIGSMADAVSMIERLPNSILLPVTGAGYMVWLQEEPENSSNQIDWNEVARNFVLGNGGIEAVSRIPSTQRRPNSNSKLRYKSNTPPVDLRFEGNDFETREQAWLPPGWTATNLIRNADQITITDSIPSN